MVRTESLPASYWQHLEFNLRRCYHGTPAGLQSPSGNKRATTRRGLSVAHTRQPGTRKGQLLG